MSFREISFASANRRDLVKAWIYSPLRTPRAIVQVAHGFGEHSRRYLHLIDTLLEAGFVVCADDHVGHGLTGVASGTLGDPGTQGDDGWKVYLEDERSLRNLAAAEFPGLPFILLGHSWGSMIARGYAEAYGEDLDALILCGVVAGMKGFDQMVTDERFASDIHAGLGGEKAGEWLGILFDGVNSRYGEVTHPNAWIAVDPDVVLDHARDPFNCFDVTKQLVYDLGRQYARLMDNAWAKKLPTRVPVYLFSGDMDPVGNYGEGLYHVANQLAETGHCVRVKSWSGYRHETHNERDIRDQVEGAIIAFINDVLNKSPNTGAAGEKTT